MSGGASLEKIAKGGNHKAFKTPHIMPRMPDCNFSFAGAHSTFMQYVKAEEQKQGKVIFKINFKILATG